MAKEEKKDITDLISQASKESTKPVVQKRKREKVTELKMGRPRDYVEGEAVMRITVKLQESTIEALRVALATKHKDMTQNTLTNMLLRKALGLKD